jgi:hypothetical protein
MPYICVFSQGEVLRAGTTERFRRSGFITTGFVFLSLGILGYIAPIYWLFLFRNLRRNNAPSMEAPPLVPAS